MASDQKNVKTAQAVQGASGTDNSALQNRIDAVGQRDAVSLPTEYRHV